MAACYLPRYGLFAVMEGLNPPQHQAVQFGGGPLVVFAGAGSGKTRVITHRIAHLVGSGQAPPWGVLAVTFTNKAAAEMRERLASLLGGRAQGLWVGTFHSICAKLLRLHAEAIGIERNFTIYDDSDQKVLVQRVIRDLGLDDKRYAPRQVASAINRAKQELVGPQEFAADDVFSEQAGRIYEEYQQRLDQARALDFGDLIFRLVRAMEADEPLAQAVARRFTHVLVDEFQDTNHAQYRLVRVLCKQHRNLCVVGDDDQSIYRWRGADRRNILDFRREFADASIVKLEQNYRSSARILRAAQAVISRNRDREPKELWTDKADGEPIVVVKCSDERDEARMIVRAAQELLSQGYSLNDMVVFYRVHAQSRALEETLRAANVPYRVVGGVRFYDRAEVRDVLAYLRVLHNPADDVSLLRIINTPTRGIGKTTLDRLLTQAAQRGEGLWATLGVQAVLDELGTGPRKKLLQFRTLMQGLMDRAASGTELGELAQAVLAETGYEHSLRQDDSPEAEARLQNIAELFGTMQEVQREPDFDPENPLASYLERVTLQTDQESGEEVQDRLTLMTVHAAKGLEFPIVIVAGLEEQMFPFRGTNLYDDPEELEEERRLAYVAFTRARERLILTFADFRRIFGQPRVGGPSRFLSELPSEELELIGWPQERAARSAGAYGSTHAPSRRDAWATSPASPPSSSESYIDTSEGSDFDGLPLQPGMQVRHGRFGVGRVRDVDSGSPPRVTVAFPEGTKKILASFLQPP